MPILKTIAIPLYFTDVSNTSRIVTWLTADYGKLSTIIKGDLRKNSLFRGQYDLFSTSELLFYDRTERGMHIAKECCMLHPRRIFRSDWRACAAVGYISALFAKTTLRHGHEPERFELFEEMLSHAETHGRNPLFTAWFDLKFAKFQGNALQLEEQGTGKGKLKTVNREQRAVDSTCHSPPASRLAYRFAPDHGGLVEPGYASKYRIPATPIAPEAVELIKQLQSQEAPPAPAQKSLNSAWLEQINRVLGKFVEYHYDLPPYVRPTAINTLHAA